MTINSYMSLVTEFAPLITLFGVIWVAIYSHRSQRDRQHADHIHAKEMAIMSVRFNEVIKNTEVGRNYFLNAQLEVSSDLYYSILEFKDAIWAYWGPFSPDNPPDKLGKKEPQDRAKIAYQKAQELRSKFYKCRLKYTKTELFHVKKLIDLINDAKTNFDFDEKPELVNFWITTQFNRSYAPIDEALKSMEKLGLPEPE